MVINENYHKCFTERSGHSSTKGRGIVARCVQLDICMNEFMIICISCMCDL